jgi:hypothetical protein
MLLSACLGVVLTFYLLRELIGALRTGVVIDRLGFRYSRAERPVGFWVIVGANALFSALGVAGVSWLIISLVIG